MTPRGRPARDRKLAGSVGALAAALLAGACLASDATAQQVVFSGDPEGEDQEALVRFLERGGYQLLTRDTVLSRDARVAGDLLVLEAAVRIAGRVDGDVYVVDGDLFLRPDARVDGDLLVLGGGFYSSSLAEVGGRIRYRPREPLRVLPEAGGYAIFVYEEPPPAFELDGTYGFQLPTYQRVDALTLGWGATARATDLAWRPELSVDVRFKTAPGDLEGSVRQYWHPGRRFGFGVEASRATRSNETWIRREWVNSAFFFVTGDDFRNYYLADRVALGFEWSPRHEWRIQFKGRWEEARSLEARDVFTLFEPRPDAVTEPASPNVRRNPAVDDGRSVSLLAVGEYERRSGRRSRTSLRLALEGADGDLAGDFSFLFAEAELALRLPGFSNHAVEIFALGRGDLAGTLPGQRRSALGGIGTLPTLPVLSLSGDRLTFAEIGYSVPLRDVARLTSLDLLLRASAGAAWNAGESAVMEKNLILAARLGPLEVGVAAGPAPEPISIDSDGSDGSEIDFRAYVDLRFDRGPRVP